MVALMHGASCLLSHSASGNPPIVGDPAHHFIACQRQVIDSQTNISWHTTCSVATLSKRSRPVNKNLRLAMEAAIIAILVTSTMDATGYTLFSALPLIAIIVFYAYRAKLGAGEIGYNLGKGIEYIRAIAIPVFLTAIAVALPWLLGELDNVDINWHRSGKNVLLMASTGIIMVAITEEGFFRGVLWRLLERAGCSPVRVLGVSTSAFVIWHLPAVLLATEFAPPLVQVPVFVINATLLGIIWGGLRSVGHSIWPATIYHSIWNALAYDLFGFGERIGALGIEATWLYGPEIGLVGMALNAPVAVYFAARVIRESQQGPD